MVLLAEESKVVAKSECWLRRLTNWSSEVNTLVVLMFGMFDKPSHKVDISGLMWRWVATSLRKLWSVVQDYCSSSSSLIEIEEQSTCSTQVLCEAARIPECLAVWPWFKDVSYDYDDSKAYLDVHRLTNWYFYLRSTGLVSAINGVGGTSPWLLIGQCTLTVVKLQSSKGLTNDCPCVVLTHPGSDSPQVMKLAINSAPLENED